ncbi:cyclic pyranopterin phosphate synthase MoaA [Actinophytocola xinjiangensis]|uniref:GTP 3',8-cyclase n=1 Tax=Actinophytocola xinjiangensis TaxID=485602 RepID=A0A7Z0WME7_9PSEU|nr:GTP 3',8-cyclase MoaA [Actinophytocola xinjiangensis]OLF10109.1 cyclic pyranopterin phosphate synthase MoaA [Actinophytocola xinjiangensis]
MSAVVPVTDRYQRPLRNLRISVTDRCNLRCRYCMPEAEYVWLPRKDLLTFEEISTLVDVFMSLGVDKVRITGGEPLLRHDLPTLVGMLAPKPGLRDLAMTTNGVLLADHVSALRDAGLGRITVSLDTLRADRSKTLSQRNSHPQVLAGLASVAPAGFTDTKIDTVAMRGVNDDELVDLIEYGRTVPAEVRFIEYMDVGGATTWSPDLVLSRASMLSTLRAHYGEIRPVARVDAAPADRFLLPDGTVFGIVSSTTQPFCGTCDRSRLTADGMWFRCLYAMVGTNLRDPLRDGASFEELRGLIGGIWGEREDRGAVDRLAERDRTPFVPVAALKANPHLEMHTRGG